MVVFALVVQRSLHLFDWRHFVRDHKPSQLRVIWLAKNELHTLLVFADWFVRFELVRGFSTTAYTASASHTHKNQIHDWRTLALANFRHRVVFPSDHAISHLCQIRLLMPHGLHKLCVVDRWNGCVVFLAKTDPGFFLSLSPNNISHQCCAICGSSIRLPGQMKPSTAY